MDFGLFYLNLSSLNKFLAQDASVIVWEMVVVFGWLILLYFVLYAGIIMYMMYRSLKSTANWKWIVLAIDIPTINIQTPKAVEQLFAHLAGAYDKPNIAQKYRGGYKQKWFSFEIISVGGYIQFLIRTEQGLRDLVESAVYAQYPEAEITEVEDYVSEIPDKYPSAEYDVWASDITLSEHYSYPIRTYREFEHNIIKETILKDPMSAFLESFSRLGQGEQMWFQIILEPTSNAWKKEAIEKIKELVTQKKSAKGNVAVDFLVQTPFNVLEEFGDIVLGREKSEAKKEEKDKKPDMVPGQSQLIEGMENKIAKIGFNTKIRAVYAARKEIFHPERGVGALIGALNQFNSPTANSLVPSFSTMLHYFRKDSRVAARKKLLVGAYKKRKMKVGKKPFVLNIEELATIWHFPMSYVKTPLVQKASMKIAEPPMGLPIERIAPPEAILAPDDKPGGSKREYVTDSGQRIVQAKDEQEFS